MTHARSVDRVRSAQASTDRELKVAQASTERDVDCVVEAVESCVRTARRAALPRHAHRAATGVDHAGVLQRLHLPGGRGAADGSAADHQDQAAGRPDPAAGLPGGGDMTADLHLDTGVLAPGRCRRTSWPRSRRTSRPANPAGGAGRLPGDRRDARWRGRRGAAGVAAAVGDGRDRGDAAAAAAAGAVRRRAAIATGQARTVRRTPTPLP